MGRLFWKFFLFIFLAQIFSILVMGGASWLHDRERRHTEEIDAHPPVGFYIEAAADTLHYGGIDALHSLLEKDLHPRIYAVDEAGYELLGRHPTAEMLQEARRALTDAAGPRSVRRIEASDGHTYLLFALAREDGGGPPPPLFPGPFFDSGPPGGPHRFPIPLPPMGVSLLASLVFAALLARYFSKPIHSLRNAFSALSQGRLDVRPGNEMGARRDELADLGHSFDHMAIQLQALMKGRQRLLYDVSHELRSPLARMQIAVGLAQRNAAKVQPALSRIERECALVDHLVDELLTLSRLDAGIGRPLDEEVKMDDVLFSIVDDARFEAQAMKRDVELSGECRAVVRGSTELLSRAIENVVRNAVRYTETGSSVRIGTASDMQANVLRITIEDQGPGVPDADLEKIFEPFFQGNFTITGTEGHGLGLAIARSVIVAHNGSIRAANLSEGGLRVDITLPLYRTAETSG